MTNKILTGLLLASTLTLSSVSAMALAPQTAGQDMKTAGTDTKDATKATGKGIAKGTKTVAHKTAGGTKTAARKTKNGTKTAVHDTGKGIEKTGDKIEGKPKPQ